MDSSLDAIVVMDSQGVILDWNAQAESMLGWHKAEALGRTVGETIIPPRFREAHRRGLTRFLASGEGPVLNRRIEFAALHRTGREFPVELSVTGYKINDQWQFTGFIADTSRRKPAEDSLRRSQEQLRAMWDHSPVLMFLKDREGRYLDINPAFLKLTERPPDQVIGRTDHEIFAPEQAAAFRKNDQKVFESNRPMEFEEMAEHPDGPHTSIVYKYPLRDAEGQPCAVGGIVADITEREQADTVRRLLIEKVMAAQEEERQHLARELHDETGQSLTALLVGLRRLDSLPTPEEMRRHAEELRTLTARALEEVRRLARGLHPHVLDDLGLGVALKHYGDEFEKTYGVTVEVFTNSLEDRRLPHSMEMVLYRIAQEALTNIAKHAHARSASIIFRGTPSDIHMIVEDDGHGFDANEVLKPSRMASHLGIHGMRKRATLLNGSLVIESVPGEGTTVYVKIPLSGDAA